MPAFVPLHMKVESVLRLAPMLVGGALAHVPAAVDGKAPTSILSGLQGSFR